MSRATMFTRFGITLSSCKTTLSDGTVITLDAPRVTDIPLRVGARFPLVMEVVHIEQPPQDASPDEWRRRTPQDAPVETSQTVVAERRYPIG